MIQINCLFRFCINCGNLGLFIHGDPIYCNKVELIRGQIILTPTLEPF